MNEFAKRIITIRTAKGMTQQEFADFCSVFGAEQGVKFSAENISSYERGSFPQPGRAVFVTKAIGMRMSTYNRICGRKVRNVNSKPRRYNVPAGKTITININN